MVKKRNAFVVAGLELVDLSFERIVALRAQELKYFFEVQGSFYYHRDCLEEKILCRRVLDIRYKALAADKHDLLVIMMNPGGSKSLYPAETKMFDRQVFADTLHVVPTQPDVTQYQTMRLMLALRVGWARVLNLSDICETKSKKLFERLKKYCFAHSVFDPRRYEERLYLAQKPRYRVYAWGHDKFLQVYGKRVLESFPGEFFGMRKSFYGFSHASPFLQKQKELWLKNIIQQVQERGKTNGICIGVGGENQSQ